MFQLTRRISNGYLVGPETRRSEARKACEERVQTVGYAEGDYEILWRHDARHQTCLREEAPHVGGRQTGDFTGHQSKVGQGATGQDSEASPEHVCGRPSQNCEGTEGALGEDTSGEGQEGRLGRNP